MRNQKFRRSKLMLFASTPILYSQKDEHAKTASLNKVVLLKVSDYPLARQFLILSLPLSASSFRQLKAQTGSPPPVRLIPSVRCVT